MFISTKVIDGFSTCFRQWKAEGTHCKFLHGYAVSFKLQFTGDLDERNWVVDFGGMKRATQMIDGKTPKDWFDYMFDHTTVIAEDDPYLPQFQDLDTHGVIELRVLPQVGCEKFAEFVFNKISQWVQDEFQERVKLMSVECREHEKNSAIFVNRV